ncbi:MAG: sigma 54-interacting transcriptional regulator [Candidatus Krumholzibacteriia bacterium]
MRNDNPRSAPPALPTGGRLQDLPLAPDAWRAAYQAFVAEDYRSALDRVRCALDAVPSGEGVPVALVPGPDVPTIKDGVLLWARCLYQLDLFGEFEVLHASAGRWGLEPGDLAALDAIQLSFACKRGEYRPVVEQATRYIDANRRRLPPAIADYLFVRGFTYSHLGDPQRAREDIEAAYSLFKVLGNQLECARSANLLGILHLRAGAFKNAMVWCGRALEGHTRLGMKKNMGGNHLNLGIAAYKRGQFGRALTEFEAARSLLREVGAQVSLCRLDVAKGNTLRLQRDFDGARRHLMTAYEEAGRLLLSREEALALEFLGDVARDEGRPDQARRYYSRALAIAGSIAPDGDIVMEVMRRQGECLQMLGRQAEAVPVLRRSLAQARRQGDRFEEAVICRVMADTMLELGDLDTALRYGRQAVSLLREVGARHELCLARMTAARVLMARAESGLHSDPVILLEEAWQDAMAAMDLALKMEIEHWIVAGRRLLNSISRHKQAAEQDLAASGGTGGGAGRPIVHVSGCMRDLIQLADAFAESAEPVLVTGETGTGKELIARRLHERSSRRQKNLVCVNVSAIPETMFAREFFGHVRGAFSGAEKDGIGLAAQADGGTLFLDEIGDLPLELQPQLLRLLQEGTYQAIGDPRERRADIRLVAATNADLRQRVAEGRFRADLYYRLKILELKIPPIHERREDILPLLRHFLGECEGRPAELAAYFSEESLDRIQCHFWPGNVREIAMVARRAYVQRSSGQAICVEIEDREGHPCFLTGPERSVPRAESGLGLKPAPRSASPSGRSRILMALTECEGNRAEAARKLGVSRSTLYRRLDKLGIGGKLIPQ